MKLSNSTQDISILNESLYNASYRIEELGKSATDLQSKVVRRDTTILRLRSEATSSENNSKLLQAAKEELRRGRSSRSPSSRTKIFEQFRPKKTVNLSWPRFEKRTQQPPAKSQKAKRS